MKRHLSLSIAGILFATSLLADPLEDVMFACTHLADDTKARVEVLETRGWTKVTQSNEAALALAHANAVGRLPSENTEEAWEEALYQEVARNAHRNWPYALELYGHFIFLDDLAPEDFKNYATCVYIPELGGRSIDLFTEAQALGTLETDRGTYRGRISRTTLDSATKGWTTVILLAGINSESNMPNGPLKASSRLTFVNGPLTPAAHK